MKMRFQQQSEHSECGLASATMLIDYFIQKINLSDLRENYGVPHGGFNLVQIQSVLSDYGVHSKAIKINAESISAVPTPFIAFWNQKHFVVIENATKSTVHIADPALGKMKMTLSEFKENFSNVVLYSTNKGHRQRTWFKLNPNLKLSLQENKNLLLRAFFVSFLAQCLSLIIPFVIQGIIDGKVNTMFEQFTQFSLAIILFLLTYFFVNMIKIRILVKLQTSIDSSLLAKTIVQLLDLPYSYFGNRSKGELIYRINSNAYIRQILVDQLLDLILSSFFMMVYLGGMFLYNPILSILTLGIAAILIFFSILNAKINQKILQNQMVVMTKSQDIVSELVNNIFTIKATNSQLYIYKKWMNNFSEQMKMERQRAKYSSILENIPVTVQSFYPLLIFLFGYILITDEQITIGGLIAFNTIGTLFLSPLLSIANSYSQLLMVKVYIDRLLDILETKNETLISGKQEINDYKGSVTLNQVSFRYSQFSKNAVSGIDLSISPNEKVAIVGASGSGKSTLLKLMSCLHRPTSGKIYYDSSLISKVQIHQLRKHVGVVLQENVLFNGSFKENILMGREYSDEKIIRSIRIANLEELISSFPLGLETKISESGHNLSGGQRQKISIARTILSNPKIIFMDEPTSALDNISEKAVMANLFEACSTMVIVAHRLSMIHHFHKIIVMDEGKIVAVGTHDKLLKESPHYQKLYKKNEGC